MKHTFRLTKPERDVLATVDLNGRLSFSEIGRRIGTSKQTARNIYERLSNTGVIRGVSPVISLNKVGRTGYGIYAQFESIDSKRQQKILQSLSELQESYWVAPLGGRFDLVFALHTQSLEKFDQIHSEIQSKLSIDLQTSSVVLRVAMTQFPRTYLGLRKKNSADCFGFGSGGGIRSIDSLDINILNHLSKDGRASSSDVAHILRTPRSTVQKRILQLEEHGVISGYYTLIHANHYAYQLYHLLVTTQDKGLKFSEALNKYAAMSSNIVTLARTIGSWDFELTCEVASAEELQTLVIDLRSTFPNEILQIETLVLFNHFIKYGYTF